VSSIGKIRKKLSNLSSGEEKLEHDIGAGNEQSFAESEDLLGRLDDLNQDFLQNQQSLHLFLHQQALQKPHLNQWRTKVWRSYA